MREEASTRGKGLDVRGDLYKGKGLDARCERRPLQGEGASG